ncbi:hypothetical protein GEMRC1_006963 [Eukaryota sp. GEM-RC1]
MEDRQELERKLNNERRIPTIKRLERGDDVANEETLSCLEHFASRRYHGIIPKESAVASIVSKHCKGNRMRPRHVEGKVKRAYKRRLIQEEEDLGE